MRRIEYDIYDDHLLEHKFAVMIDDYDVIVKSPVITDQNLIMKEAISKGMKIITDIELFYLQYPWKSFITVTGTNGKTTTVNLISKLLSNIDLGGNIGKPIFDFMNSYRDVIIEASSFMLEYVEHFHSKINVFLNISPNHIDHHHTYSKYIKSKLNLIKNIKKEDYVVYNYDDKLLRRIFKYLDCQLIPFSTETEVDGGYIRGSNVFFKNNLILNVENIHLLGNHNISNIIASVCASLCYNKDIEGIEEVVSSFKPIEHRIEYVGQINSIKIYNDSKSTNCKALKIALDSFVDEKILLICGGKIREDNIEVLNDSISLLKIVLINGENKDIMGEYFIKNNIKVALFDTLEDCLNGVSLYINEVSMILFSPGAASYDQFKNYEERGKYFKNQIIYTKL